MRLAPVPLYYANDAELAMKFCTESSLTTHGAQGCTDACKYLGSLIIGAIRGEKRETIMSPFYHPISGYWDNEQLIPGIQEVAAGSYKRKKPPAIKGSGYVVASLEAALWAFYKSDTFEEGALLAVNLGDDADTTGAVYGQIAGAFYGIEKIPLKWRNVLHRYSAIEELAQKLYRQSMSVKRRHNNSAEFK
jgi:ADP-ribosylglycohydrolase